MDLLYRKGEYVIDVEQCKVFSSDHQSSFTFDFENWKCVIGRTHSMPKPIRYCSKNDVLLYWANKQWCWWSEEKNEAIISLFHTWQEWQIINN